MWNFEWKWREDVLASAGSFSCLVNSMAKIPRISASDKLRSVTPCCNISKLENVLIVVNFWGIILSQITYLIASNRCHIKDTEYCHINLSYLDETFKENFQDIIRAPMQPFPSFMYHFFSRFFQLFNSIQVTNHPTFQLTLPLHFDSSQELHHHQQYPVFILHIQPIKILYEILIN